jgi:putative FmdB family regulatory protein
MPLYEYECDACSRRFEVIQKFSDPPPNACRHCGKGPVHRLASSPAIQFKGSGWYVTDYAQKGKSDQSSTPSNKTDDAKSDSGASASSEGNAGKSDKSDKSDAAKSDAGKSDTSKGDTAASTTKSASSPSKESKE